MKELKGFVDPVRVYEVGEERAVYSRFEAISAAGLTPLIGRAEELVILHDVGNRRCRDEVRLCWSRGNRVSGSRV